MRNLSCFSFGDVVHLFVMNQIESKSLQINLNLNLFKIPAIIGINRAIIFNKMALSAEYNALNINNYCHGNNNTSFNISFNGHQEIKDTDLTEYKEAFYSWIALNGLREIVESFYIFLDEIVCVLHLFRKQNSSQVFSKDVSDIRDEIKNKKISLSEKFRNLSKDFGIELENQYKTHFLFFEEMRHCISHNLGVVIPKYFACVGKGGNVARVTWVKLDLYTINKAEKKKSIKLGGGN